MRTLLAVTIALLLSGGTVLATPAMAVKSNVAVAENILDKLIAVVKKYSGKVEAADSVEALNAIYQAFKQEMTEFGEKHAGEIAAFDKYLSAEQIEKYKVAFETAIKHFEKSLEKKAMQFME